MAGAQGQPGGAGQGAGGAGQGAGGGNKMNFGDVFTNFIAPAGAVVASTYGPRYAAGAAVGMRAIESLQENKRRRELGKKIVRMSDLKAEEDLKIRKDMWNQVKTEATRMGVEDSILAGAPGAEQTTFDETGMPVVDFAGQADKLKQTKNEEFLKKMPEPERNALYDFAGAIAPEAPDVALEMLSKRDMAQDALAKMRMDQVWRSAEAEQDRKLEQVQQAAKFTFEADKLALDQQQHEELMKVRAKEFDEQMKLQRAELRSNIERNEAYIGSQESQNQWNAVNKLYDQITDQYYRVITLGGNPEEDPLYQNLTSRANAINASLTGSEGVLDLNAPPADQTVGATDSGAASGQAGGLLAPDPMRARADAALASGVGARTNQPPANVSPDARLADVRPVQPRPDASTTGGAAAAEQAVAELPESYSDLEMAIQMNNEGKGNYVDIMMSMDKGYTPEIIQLLLQRRREMGGDQAQQRMSEFMFGGGVQAPQTIPAARGRMRGLGGNG